ncbi:MAG: radical SAM protein [bacterium]
MKKILLVKTAELFHKTEEPQAVPHGGIGYIASSLRKKGYEVFFIDALAEGFGARLWLNTEWYRVGLSREELKNRVEEITPDFIGISAQFTSQHEMLEETVEDVRFVTNAPIIVGGVHATFMPNLVLGIKGVDYVLRGEAEESLPLLLKARESDLDKVPGLSFRNGKKLVHNSIGCYPDIARLPFPARKIYPGASSKGDLYSELNAPHGHKFDPKNLPYYEIITSRGCNYNCHGCAGSHFAGNNRTRDANNVLDEIEILINNFGMRSLAVIDDNFIQDKIRATDILKSIVERGYNLNLTFPNGLLIGNLFLRDGSVDEKFIELLSIAGTTEVDLPVETASARIMKKYLSSKYDTRLNLGKLCKVLSDKGIKVSGYFMIGFPDETREEMEFTVKLAQKLQEIGLHNSWFFLVGAFPGSEFWKNVKHPSKKELRNLRFRRASLKLNKNINPVELQKILVDSQRSVNTSRIGLI